MGNTSPYGKRALIRIGGRMTPFYAFFNAPIFPYLP